MECIFTNLDKLIVLGRNIDLTEDPEHHDYVLTWKTQSLALDMESYPDIGIEERNIILPPNRGKIKFYLHTNIHCECSSTSVPSACVPCIQPIVTFVIDEKEKMIIPSTFCTPQNGAISFEVDVPQHTKYAHLSLLVSPLSITDPLLESEEKEDAHIDLMRWLPGSCYIVGDTQPCLPELNLSIPELIVIVKESGSSTWSQHIEKEWKKLTSSVVTVELPEPLCIEMDKSPPTLGKSRPFTYGALTSDSILKHIATVIDMYPRSASCLLISDLDIPADSQIWKDVSTLIGQTTPSTPRIQPSSTRISSPRAPHEWPITPIMASWKQEEFLSPILLVRSQAISLGAILQYWIRSAPNALVHERVASLQKQEELHMNEVSSVPNPTSSRLFQSPPPLRIRDSSSIRIKVLERGEWIRFFTRMDDVGVSWPVPFGSTPETIIWTEPPNSGWTQQEREDVLQKEYKKLLNRRDWNWNCKYLIRGPCRVPVDYRFIQ